MDLEMMDDIMEALHLAARVVNGLPKLPEPLKNGMLPVLVAVSRLQDREEGAKVTDISKYLHLTSPGVIRLIGQCEKAGLLVKMKATDDKRVTNLRLTEKGDKVLDRTLNRYHRLLADRFEKYSDEEWRTLVKLLYYAFDVAGEVGRELNNKLPDWTD